MTDIFPLSLFICTVLWFLNKNLRLSFIQNLRIGPQNFHTKSISRLGGAAIYFPLLIVSYLDNSVENYAFLRTVLLCTFPIFFTGLIDDLKIRVQPTTRLLLFIPTPLLLYYFVGLRIDSVGISFIDTLLQNELFSIIFLCFSLVGMSNAFNIIDGFNGLLLSYSLTLLTSLIIGYESLSGIDWLTFNVGIFLSVFAVFIFNFPFGKIFLGDAGAYLLGVLIPVGLIKYTFDNNFSPWFVMAMLIYPFTEVLISVIRKVFFRKMSALKPDGLHFHMLVYKKITKRVGFKKIRLRHFIVTTFMLILNTPFLIVANFFKDNSLVLQFLCIWFIVMYVLIYFVLLPKYAFKKK